MKNVLGLIYANLTIALFKNVPYLNKKNMSCFLESSRRMILAQS